jgi:hypothetical protein
LASGEKFEDPYEKIDESPIYKPFKIENIKKP